MRYDLVIRGGDVIDGSGAERRRADVAIRDSRIVEVGDVDEGAARVVDADGLIVAPGIVDIHTHYDAQVLWDPACTPSPLHGVTTVISGNCGFTIAPVEPSETDYLARMLSHVEGMPLEALQEGVDFRWRSFGDYLDRLEGSLGINMGLLVGHSALRRVVMGDDAVGGTPTPEQLDAMCALLGRSLEEGGLGFSSSQSKTHNDGDGRPVPSRWAERDELLALATVAGQHPGTVLEFIPGVPPFGDRELDLMGDMALAANRSINWNVLSVAADRGPMIEGILASHERVWSRGADVVPLTLPASPNLFVNFHDGYALFDPLPGWAPFMALPDEEKARRLADPVERKRLDDLAHSPEAGMLADAVANWGAYTISSTRSPENKPLEGRTVAEVAEDRGLAPFDAMVEIALRDGLATIFRSRRRGDDDQSWAMRRELWRHPRIVVGASDAGAHLNAVVTFNYASDMLAASTRARAGSAGGGSAPPHRCPRAFLRDPGPRPSRGGRPRRRVRLRPGAHRVRPGALAGGHAGGRGSPLRRGGGSRARLRQRDGDGPGQAVARRPLWRIAPVGARHRHRSAPDVDEGVTRTEVRAGADAVRRAVSLRPIRLTGVDTPLDLVLRPNPPEGRCARRCGSRA